MLADNRPPHGSVLHTVAFILKPEWLLYIRISISC